MPNSDQTSPAPSAAAVATATSELNNLLQIMSTSGSSIEQLTKNNPHASRYLELLHSSIARAEKVTALLTTQAGGSNTKKLLHPDIASPAIVTKASGPLSAKRTILVVDDEPAELTLIERILVEAGFEVVTARSGFECLELFRMHSHRFALVLLDRTLPFMTGEETFARLGEIRKDVPVVLCTGFVHQELLAHMMENGLAGFLRKPIPPDEIVGLVRSILQSAKYSRDNVVVDDLCEAS